MNDKITLLFKSITETFSACPKYNMAMAACLLVVGLMPALNVYSTGQLVAIFEHPNGANSIVFVILLWGVSMLLPTLLEPLISYLQSHINQLVTHKITTNLMYKNASFRGLHAYDDTDIQDTTAVLKNQSRFRPTNFIVNSVVIIRECITIGALSVILFSVNWWIPFAVLLSSAPLSYINFRVASFSWQALMKAGKHNRFMDYFSTLTFSREAQKDIHLFKAYDLIVDKYHQAFERVYRTLRDAQFNIFIKPIPFQCIAVVVMAIILFSLYEQNKTATIAASSIVVLLQSIFMLNNRMDGLIQHSALLYEVLDYFKKYFSFLAYSHDIEDGQFAITTIETIAFVNVSFKYPNTDTYILKNINFSARVGESIAIVGHNGAGKTTLVQLICRFWDVTEGRILINNQDIRAYKIAALRDCIGAVFQDFFKFNLSINDNITLNKNSRARPSDVKHALGLADDVSLDTFIGKSYGGIELSGGQWQQLAILRCLHANSSMIILDEPTSAIDPKAEAKLYDDFNALCRGRLSFMITHRLGSINGVDRVLVIDNGRLVQDGTPAHLKAVEGMFQELWRIQSAMYAH